MIKEIISQRKDTKNDDDNNSCIPTTAPIETSFAQFKGEIICPCCGKKGHIAPQCPMKNKIPRSEWAIKKAEMHMQSISEKSHDDSSIESGTETTNSKSSAKKQEWSGMQLTLYHQLSDVPSGSSGIGMSMYSDSMGDNITLDTGKIEEIDQKNKLAKFVLKVTITAKIFNFK